MRVQACVLELVLDTNYQKYKTLLVLVQQKLGSRMDSHLIGNPSNQSNMYVSPMTKGEEDFNAVFAKGTWPPKKIY